MLFQKVIYQHRKHMERVCNLYRERDRSIKIVLFLIVGSVSLSSGETVPTKWRPCQDEIITTAETVENQDKTIENKSKVLQITNKNTNNIVNTEPKLPILVNLGESEYTKIKTNLAPRVGSQENQ